MSVTSVKLLNVTGSLTEDFHREYSGEVQIATTDAVNDGPVTVLNAVLGVYPYGSTFVHGTEGDILAVVRSIGNVRRRGSGSSNERLIWSADVKWSTRGTQRDPSDPPGDPTNWAWRIRGLNGTGQKWLTKDRTGRALVNSSDEPFEDVPPIDDPNAVLSLEKNTPTLSLSQWTEARGKVNSASLWGLDARCVRLVKWDWQVQWTGPGQAYVANTFEVHVKEDGYYYEPADVGYRERSGVNIDGTPAYTPILVNGEIPTKPVYLNGAGHVKQDGNPVVYFDGQGGNPDPFELEYEYDLGSIFPASLPVPIVS